MAADHPPTADFDSAFEALVRAHYERLGNLAYRYLKSDAAAEDAVQEVLLKVWRRREVVNLANPLPYLYHAVRNECLMALRRRRRWAMSDLDAQPLECEAGVSDAEIVDLEAAIARAVNALPDRCRLIYTMHREQDLSYAEIAGILGISPKTVENQMGRALKALRERLAAFLPLIVSTLAASAWDRLSR
jgi:RNA polymerase sigma-70 factor (ECF subfamily)